jgi:hypothetical protein
MIKRLPFKSKILHIQSLWKTPSAWWGR